MRPPLRSAATTLFALALLATPLLAEVRTWRDQESEVAVDAELIKVEGDQITLKLANGKTYTYAVTRFHPDDQAYAKEWSDQFSEAMAEKAKADAVAPDTVRRALQVSAKQESKAGATERTGDKDAKGKTRTATNQFHITLANARGGPAMKGLTVDSVVYTRRRTADTRDKEGNRTIFLQEKESQTVESLLPGTSTTVKTKSLTTTDSTTPYKEEKKTYEKRLSEEVIGIVVKVSVDGALATTIEQPAGLLRTVKKGE